ncbi:chymotrypsin-2-like [Lycorma delicatula]|uniref:chymotrypsin-2-like n=1 Tax=Lycorma delicatula TaxID=130591 RepID=UPI003F517C03
MVLNCGKQQARASRDFVAVLEQWLNNAVSKKPKIVGGEIAKQGEFPYFVSVQRIMKPDYFLHFCGGGILSKDVILTAGHCCFKRDFSNRRYFIAAGITDLNDKNSGMLLVEKCIIHPDYNDKINDNDIAVLLLERSINFTSRPNIRPISYSSKPIENDQNCSVMGFGATGASGKVFSTNLKTLMQRVQNNDLCQQFFNYFNPNSMFCAGAVAGEDTCIGDSGSPFVCSGVIYGVVSYGVENCGLGVPTIYTNVPSYGDWIKKNMIAVKSGKSCLYFLTLYPYYIFIFIHKTL